MRKLIVLLAVIASSAIIVTSCGGKKTAEIPAATAETVEGQKSQLAEALSTGNLRQASAMADSMSLFVDDFTPEQTVQVLSAFVKVYSDAQSKRESRRALETVRKYVDVYDIALSVNPKDPCGFRESPPGRHRTRFRLHSPRLPRKTLQL